MGTAGVHPTLSSLACTLGNTAWLPPPHPPFCPPRMPMHPVLLPGLVPLSVAAGLDVSTLRQAMELIGARQVETEASGNVTLDTVR